MGDRLIIDGEPTDACKDWSVSNPDVVGEFLENRFMLDVIATCRSMGPRGQQMYVRLRRAFIEEPVMSSLDLLKHRNGFPDLPVWAQWLDEAYLPVAASAAVDGQVARCDRCRQLMAVHAALWRCPTPRCRAEPASAGYTLIAAKGLHALRRDLVAYVSLPGRPEADLAKSLVAAGATVTWWPDIDAFDLHAVWPEGQRWAIDMKDWRVPYLLAQQLKPLPSYPAGHEARWDRAFVVVPDDRAKQRRYLATLRKHSPALRGPSAPALFSVTALLAQAPGGSRGA